MSKVTERPNPVDNPPVGAVDVPTRWVKKVKNLEPGHAIRLTIEATVKSVMKQTADSATLSFPGHLTFEIREMKVQRANTFYDEILNDDEG